MSGRINEEPGLPTSSRQRPSDTDHGPQSTVHGSTIQIVDPLSDPSWDDRVLSLPSYSFFHSSGWARVLRDTYGYKPVYFVLSDDNGLRSLLPIMEVYSLLTGRRGSALPFSDDCDGDHVDPEEFAALFRAAQLYGKERGWQTLECRGGVDSVPDATPSTSFYGHRLDLKKSHHELFSGFYSSVRRAIRKAERSGLRIEKSSDRNAILDYYALHCLTRRRHGLPPQPIRMFENIHRDILSQGNGFVILGRKGLHAVAGAVFLHFGTHAIFKFGASVKETLHSRPNNLIMWEGIKRLADLGLPTLHFGRTSFLNKGLRNFKRGWGTTESRIDYLKYDLKLDRYLQSPDRTQGWHNALFRLMPIPLARLVGSMLYKHVA
ncbi:MAG: GNAT family N-acetyltransferase [Opitutaceae bacterium]